MFAGRRHCGCVLTIACRYLAPLCCLLEDIFVINETLLLLSRNGLSEPET